MRIMLSSLLFLAACSPGARQLQAAADADAATRAALDHELAGFTPGRPQTCIQQTELRNSRGFGEHIVYESGRNERLVNRTSGGCEQYGEWAYLVTQSPQSQLCRGDIATVVDRTTQQPIGSCVFGDFTPYRRAGS
ncbi:hypothetical protein [Sphingomonas sp.]|uniref:hypothetical protein n=1 Tax=Sphingomonas sp. TaxID=28214 RepID=UPI003CC68A72